jgi:hypothetical protein
MIEHLDDRVKGCLLEEGFSAALYPEMRMILDVATKLLNQARFAYSRFSDQRHDLTAAFS